MQNGSAASTGRHHDWRSLCGRRLVTPAEAVRVVEDGDRVVIAMGSVWMNPTDLIRALFERSSELHDVVVDTSLSRAWSLHRDDKTSSPFTTSSLFVMSGRERRRLTQHHPDADYVPMNPSMIGTLSGRRHREELTERHTAADVCLVAVTPPDEHGFVSFGTQVWLAPTQLKRARCTIAEVIEGLPVIPGGDNHVPLKTFDLVVEGRTPPTPYASEPVPEHELDETHACGQLVASLIDDGDTVMFGGGAIPMRMAPYLRDKADLGCHTEVICPLELVRAGVITGARRTVAPGKVSATAILPSSPEEAMWLDGNEGFDLRDMSVNNDPRYIARNENLVAINAALEVSLWGEIGVERVGSRYHGGIGGHVEFVLGALLSPGGRSIHAVLSRKRDADTGELVSTITSALREPSVTSVPRHLADFVVTEHGIASLMGKTERERAQALISVAHPDFRSDLADDAKRLLGVGRRTFFLGGS